MMNIKISVEYGKTFGYWTWEVHTDRMNEEDQVVNKNIKRYSDKGDAIRNAKAIREEFPNAPINIYTMKGEFQRTI